MENELRGKLRFGINRKFLCYSILFYSVLALFVEGNATPVSKAQQKNRRINEQPLTPFAFDSRWADTNTNDIHQQKSAPVCVDFLEHLNHPRTDALFNRDGTLVRESTRIKSVHWVPLDKEQYRAGFMNVLVGEHRNVQATFLEYFADEHRVLQRIMANPEIDRREKNHDAYWLYRLTLDAPMPYDYHNPDGRMALPTWFPRASMEWLGDDKGNFRLVGTSTLIGGAGQWFLYAGITYMVHSRDYPGDFNIDVFKVIINFQGNAYMRVACDFRSKKKSKLHVINKTEDAVLDYSVSRWKRNKISD